MRSKTIPSSWTPLNGHRLDSGPYLSGAVEAKVALGRLSARNLPLEELTKHGRAGVFHAGRESRIYLTDPQFAIPFLGSTDILRSELTTLPLISRKITTANPRLLLQEGWTLISRSGTIGKMAYAGPNMAKLACSEDVLRVVADPDKVRPGYLYAYLRSRYGVPQVVDGTYGAIIKHIEPEHIWGLAVPRLGQIEERAHRAIVEAASLRGRFQDGIQRATTVFFDSVGIKDISADKWHRAGPDLGFSPSAYSSRSLRASNYNPRLQLLKSQLQASKHIPLGDLCKEGILGYGHRFRRVDCDPSLGIRLIGQRELFHIAPEGRWIAPQYTPPDVRVDDETVLVAGQGTLGEGEVFCRAQLITGQWLDYVYNQHFIRVKPGPDYSGALLFAFLRSESVFRYLRSISTGSKQQSLHMDFLAELPVPIPDKSAIREVEATVRTAFQERDHAFRLEAEAVQLVEAAIQEV